MDAVPDIMMTLKDVFDANFEYHIYRNLPIVYISHRVPFSHRALYSKLGRHYYALIEIIHVVTDLIGLFKQATKKHRSMNHVELLPGVCLSDVTHHVTRRTQPDYSYITENVW